MARRKSSAQKAAESAVKKSHPVTVFLVILFLIVGCVGGVFASVQLTKNDCFELKGESVIQLDIGDTYTEQGVTIRSFGRDISEKAVRGGDADLLKGAAEEGIYQIVYTVSDIRWGDYQRVRVVIVGDPEGAEDYLPQSGVEA